MALLARDRGFPAIRFQMPIYPMIDDANETPSSHEITDIGIWDRAATSRPGSGTWASGKPDQYAAPARAEDLSGLPPAFIDVGTATCSATRTSRSPCGSCRPACPPNCTSTRAPTTRPRSSPRGPLSRRIWERRFDALRRALA